MEKIKLNLLLSMIYDLTVKHANLIDEVNKTESPLANLLKAIKNCKEEYKYSDYFVDRNDDPFPIDVYYIDVTVKQITFSLYFTFNLKCNKIAAFGCSFFGNDEYEIDLTNIYYFKTPRDFAIGMDLEDNTIEMYGTNEFWY